MHISSTLRSELVQLLLRGQFVLRKWASNDSRLLSNIPPDHLLSSDAQSMNVLGIPWEPLSDRFTITVPTQILSRPSGTLSHSKRTVIATIARIYDPCGWISPILLLAKSFLQSLWLHPLEWDSILPRDLAATWDNLLQSLLSSPPFSIPRTVSPHSGLLQLHGFCDASKRGYAAVLYVRSVNHGSVSLLVAKSRVALLKLLSIPKLELQGAHLLSKLYNHFSSLLKPMNLLSEQAFLWCDSSVV
jgi:hypothetical protein